MSYLSEYERIKKEQQERGTSSMSPLATYHAIKGDTESVADNLNTRVQQWSDNYGRYTELYTERFANSDNDRYVSDSSEWLGKVSAWNDRFKQEADTIKGMLKTYGDLLNPEYTASVNKYLDDALYNQSEVLKYSSDNNDYWSQFKDEAEWTEAINNFKDREAKKNYDVDAAQKELEHLKNVRNSYDTLVNGEQEVGLVAQEGGFAGREKPKGISERTLRLYTEDFGGAQPDEWDNIILQKEKYLNQAKAVQDEARIEGADDPLSQYYDSDYQKYIEKGKQLLSARAIISGGTRDGSPLPDTNLNIITGSTYTYSDEEKEKYLYALGKYGANKAINYVMSLDQAKAAEEYNKIKDADGSWALKIIAGAPAGIEQFAIGSMNAIAGVVGADPINSGYYSTFGQLGRKGLSDAGKVAYDITSTTVNMLPSILVSTLTGNPAIGAATLGASAGGNAYAEMVQLGYNKDQARMYGILTGVSEAGLEYVLGGISKLGGTLSGHFVSKLSEAAISKIDNLVAKFAIKYGVQMLGEMGSEGVEEFLQDLLDPVFKYAVTGGAEGFEGVDLGQALYSGILGALSAGVLNGFEGGIQNANTLSTAKDIKATFNTDSSLLDTLQKAGATYDAETLAPELAKRINANSSAWDIAMLLHEMSANVSEQTQNDIEKALVERGFLPEDAKTHAKAFAYAALGGKFSDAQKSAIENNSVLADAVIDTIVDRNSTVNLRLMALAQLGVTNNPGSLLERSSADETAKQTPENIAKNINERNKAAERGITESGSIDYLKRSNGLSAADQEIVNKILSKKATERTIGERITAAKEVNPGNISENVAVKATNGENGEIKYENEKGKTVSYEEASFPSEASAQIYKFAEDSGYSASTANGIVSVYKSLPTEMSVDSFLISANDAYLYGKLGGKIEAIPQNSAFYDLPESTRNFIYKLGSDERNAEFSADQEKIDKAISENKKTVSKEKGKITYLTSPTQLTDIQKTSLDTIGKVVSDITRGLDVVYYESTVNKDGKRVFAQDVKTSTATYKAGTSAPNGFYDRDARTIYLDINAGSDGEGTILWTFAHELTHDIRLWSPGRFKVLADFLMSGYGKKGVDIKELVENQILKARGNGRKIGYTEAYEEVIADSMQTMFSDQNALEKLEKLKLKDKTLWEKIRDSIKEFFEKIRSLYARYSPDTKEGELVRDMGEAAERLADLFAEGVVGAEENFDKLAQLTFDDIVETEVTTEAAPETAQKTPAEAPATVEETAPDTTAVPEETAKAPATEAETVTETPKKKKTVKKTAPKSQEAEVKKVEKIVEKANAQYDASTESAAPDVPSLRTWTESEFVQDRKAAAEALSESLGVSYRKALKYIDDINSVARLIADDRVRLDYDPNLDPKATVLKPNSEYKWSVDMSTLCAKRLLTTGTFDAIQRALPNHAFTSEEIVALRKMMEDRGYQVACGICYVESTRREMGPITQEFIERYKEAQKTGDPISRINSKGEAVALSKGGKAIYAEDGYVPTLADLNTTNIDLVKKNHPEVYDAYLAFMNARGQAKPKLLETRAEYKGEILKTFKRNKDGSISEATKARNASGGLRLQSFSDFEVPHLIDMMQIVLDMASVGLKSQAYTKVPDFADAFGNTGIKINLSLIAKGTGLDADGNLVFDDVEGMDHNKAFELRKKYSKNVGTILVGKSDAHIIAALADPRIDFVIPFHKSSWKESLYEALGLTGYEDYTEYQNEKSIDPSRKIKNFDPSEYWDFSKSGDENAQIYLQKCKEDGRIPKFPQFQSYPGYWKLLIDFKMYDNSGKGSPQTEVKPNFNNDVNERILNDYKGGHRSFPVAQDVVDDFVAQYDGVRESGRGNGYDGYSMSNNARSAYADGEMPLSRWTKSSIVDAIEEINPNIDVSGLTLETLKQKFLKNAGWHHTSKNYNVTDFYAINDKYVSSLTQEDVDNIKNVPTPQATSRDDSVIEKVNDASRKIDIIIASGMLKNRSAVISRIASGKDIETAYNKAVSILKAKESKRVEQWKKLPSDHWRQELVNLFENDFDEYLNRELSIKPLSKNSAEFKRLYDTFAESAPESTDSYSGGDVFSDRDSEYLELAKDPIKNENALDKRVAAEAKANGYTTPKLYHGTRFFGFTEFKPREAVPFIFASSDRTVSANYAGDNHYAGVRRIGKGFKQSNKLSDIIENAKTVWGADLHQATTGEKRRAYQTVIDNAAAVADKLETLRVDLPDSMTDEEINYVAWVEEILWQAQGVKNDYVENYFNISDENERRAYRNEWKHDIEMHKEEVAKLRKYYEDNYDNLTKEQKKYLQFLLGYEVGDAVIDLEYTMQRAISDGRILANPAGALNDADELQDAMEQIHNIGSYELYGNLGSNPFTVDAQSSSFLAIKVPEMGDQYYDTDSIAKWAKENGYTSVIIKNVYDYGNKADDYIFFDPNQVKSADPVTYDADGNVIPLSERFNTAKDDIRYSDRNNTSYNFGKSFSEQVDDLDKGVFPANDTLVMGGTPKRFQDIGLLALPMTYTQKHAREAIANADGDHLGKELLKKVPQALDDPIAIIDSASKPGRLVAIIELPGQAKNIVAAVEIDGAGTMHNERIDSNAITSVYSKGNAITKLLADAVKSEALGKGGIYYWQKNKASALARIHGVQFPGSSTVADGFIRSIHDSKSNVKPRLKNIFETQQFKRWFGKSKAVNEDGTPKVFYHGTDADFTVFDRTKGRSTMDIQGMFFSPWELDAQGYGSNVGAYYLSIKNPAPEGVAYRALNKFKGQNNAGVKAREYLESLGYDGVNNEDEEWIAFYPEQIKSATDNIGTFDSSNPDIRFSDRDPSFVGKRQLLATALESAAQNDAERELLTKYKEKIGEMEAEQTKLAELRKQIHDISFTKSANGKRDETVQKRLNDLMIEAKQTANRIDIYDKQLLRLEAAEPLRNVLAKAKADAAKKAAAEGREALQKYRSEVNERISSAGYKARIEADKATITKWILHPDRKDVTKHVPDAVKNPVINFLNSIDFSTGRPGKGGDISHRNAQLLRNAQALERALTGDVDLEGMYENLRLHLPEDFVPTLKQFTDDITSLIGDSQEYVIRKMTAEQLKALSKVLKNLKHSIQEMNRFHNNSRYEYITDAARNSTKELRSAADAKRVGGLKNYLYWRSMRPAYAFERFGEGGKAVWDELRQGQARVYMLSDEFVKFAEDAYTTKEAKEWEKPITVHLSTGDVTLPPSYIMSFYELYKRPQSRESIENGEGFRVATYKKGSKVYSDVGHRLSEADIQTLFDALTPRQKEVADNLQQYMATRGGELLNEVSIARFGEAMFGEETYFPKNSDGQHLRADVTAQGEEIKNASLYALINASFTKELKEGASNRLLLFSIFDVFANHMSSVAQYNGMALPILDAVKWLNYAEYDENGNRTASLRDEMARVYGKPVESRSSGTSGYAEKFITNVLKSYNGTESFADPNDSFALSLLHRYNASRIAYNLRVAFQQPTAIARAALVIKPTILMKAATMNLAHLKQNIEEMQKYSGIAIAKKLGFYDTNVSRGVAQMIKHDESPLDKVVEFGMIGAEKADQITWAAIWQAAKLDIDEQIAKKKAKNLPTVKIGSDEYFDAVNDRFEEVIYKTQVVDSVLTKTEFARAKGWFARMSSSFMSEGVASVSPIIAAYERMQNAKAKGDSTAWKKYGGTLLKAIGVYAVSALLTAAVQAAADMFRDDDEYETYPEKYVEAFKKDILDSLNPLSKIPIFSDAWEAVKEVISAFGVDTYGNPPETVIAQLTETLKKFAEIVSDKITGKNNNYTWAGAVYKLLDFASGISGIPASPAFREVMTIWNNTVGILAPSLLLKTYDSGDLAEIKYAYKDGYLTEEEAINELIAKGVTSNDKIGAANEAYFKVQEWKHTGEGSYSRYGDAYAAALAGDVEALKAAKKVLTDHGYTEKDVNTAIKSKLTSELKPLYAQAYASRDLDEVNRVIEILTKSGLYGRRSEVAEYVKKWR